MQDSASQPTLFEEVSKGADLSFDRIYRYSLWRIWNADKPFVLFIGLNPSTADENEDDPTIRRCINFARRWGYGGLYMANLFALRATNPAVMKAHKTPIGLGNDDVLLELSTQAGLIVCAWGTHGAHLSRENHVYELLKTHKLMCLDLTKNGHPKHPLYIKSDAEPKPYVK
jgi:hypothetical protein